MGRVFGYLDHFDLIRGAVGNGLPFLDQLLDNHVENVMRFRSASSFVRPEVAAPMFTKAGQ